MSSQKEQANAAPALRKEMNPKKFDGMEERQFPPKPWPPGKPPGGRLPPAPTTQDQSASPPDKPAK